MAAFNPAKLLERSEAAWLLRETGAVNTPVAESNPAVYLGLPVAGSISFWRTFNSVLGREVTTGGVHDSPCPGPTAPAISRGLGEETTAGGA